MTIKIRIKTGSIKVDYEGPEDFLDSKLPKLVSEVTTLAEQIPAGSDNSNSNEDTESRTPAPLASFLKEKKAASQSQTRRFLATAQWLHQKGRKRIKTQDVTKALRESNQKRVSNASECLNRNISKGFCERDGKEFFVTEEGRNSLG